jgi:Tol biopolymer transport system component
VNADGTGRRDISSSADEVATMAWSPDGTHLAVARGKQGARDLWIMDLEGNFLRQVTDAPGSYGVWDWR